MAPILSYTTTSEQTRRKMTIDDFILQVKSLKADKAEMRKVFREIMNETLPEYTVEGIGKVKGSWNLGRIEGGEVYNIVADKCSIWFDRRLVHGETQEQVQNKISKVIDKYNSENKYENNN